MSTDDAERRLEEVLAEHREPAEETGAEEPEETEAGPVDPFAPLPSTTAEEAEDQDSLPDAALFALLRTVEAEIGIESIDRIWVFPPRRLEVGETAVVVVSAHDDGDARRRVYAAHYTALDDADEPRLSLQEHGTAPPDRVGRLVEEVVDRLGDDPSAAPRGHDIGGEADRWHAVLHELAEAFLEQARRHPRLRR